MSFQVVFEGYQPVESLSNSSATTQAPQLRQWIHAVERELLKERPYLLPTADVTPLLFVI
jgi:hypothetical protein